MGWLKRLFKKKEIEKLTINVNEVDDWLDNRISPVVDLLNKELADLIKALKENIEQLNHQIYELENAEITHKGHVDNKVKSIVLGHKTNYIRMLNNFINSLEFPEEINYKTAMDFYLKTSSYLDKFSQESVKTFYTVQHLFHKQVDDIAKTIKQFDTNLRQIKNKIEQKHFDLFEDAKYKLKDLRGQLKKKDSMLRSLEEDKNKLESSKQARMDFVSRLEEFKKSREYLDYQKLENDKNNAESELNSLETGLIQLFSPLEHALKKFQKITLEDEDVIGDYIDKPVDTLVNDHDFRIIDVLLKLKKNILSDSIELKDKKREKTLEAIDRIDREKLDSFLNERNNILDKKKKIEHQLKINTSLQSIKEIEYKIEHTTSLIEKLKSKIEEAEKQLSSLDYEKIKSDLEEMLKKITGVEVSISF